MKLVDTLVLGTSALSREGSSPFIRTQKSSVSRLSFSYFRLPQNWNSHLTLRKEGVLIVLYDLITMRIGYSSLNR